MVKVCSSVNFLCFLLFNLVDSELNMKPKKQGVNQLFIEHNDEIVSTQNLLLVTTPIQKSFSEKHTQIFGKKSEHNQETYRSISETASDKPDFLSIHKSIFNKKKEQNK